jgi:thiol-disulfide isomerase/thioredoxin
MKKLLFLCLTLLFFAAGCSDNNDETSEIRQEKEYTVSLIDDKGLTEIINNRMGKALFINVWATWCVPCVEEFPDIVKVTEYYKDSDVDFLSLNVDMSSQTDSLVIPFLKAFKADFPVYNVREKSAENVINLLNEKWNGAIPATFIYDKNGKQRIFILGSDNYSNFRSAIDSVRSL